MSIDDFAQLLICVFILAITSPDMAIKKIITGVFT